MTLLDRMAKAYWKGVSDHLVVIHNALPDRLTSWAEADEQSRTLQIAGLRAALIAAREPSEAMRAAGFEADALHFGGITPVEKVWQAMIDAILEEKP